MFSRGRRQLGSVSITLIKQKIRSLLFIDTIRNFISSFYYILCQENYKIWFGLSISPGALKDLEASTVADRYWAK